MGRSDLSANRGPDGWASGDRRHPGWTARGSAASGEGDRIPAAGWREADDQAAVARLLPLRGVGRWTAEYVLLRGLGRLRVFPGDDVGARNSLRRWLGLAEPPSYEEIRQLLLHWSAYQGLVYFHLLLGRLAGAGLLP